MLDDFVIAAIAVLPLIIFLCSKKKSVNAPATTTKATEHELNQEFTAQEITGRDVEPGTAKSKQSSREKVKNGSRENMNQNFEHGSLEAKSKEHEMPTARPDGREYDKTLTNTGTGVNDTWTSGSVNRGGKRSQEGTSLGRRKYNNSQLTPMTAPINEAVWGYSGEEKPVKVHICPDHDDDDAPYDQTAEMKAQKRERESQTNSTEEIKLCQTMTYQSTEEGR